MGFSISNNTSSLGRSIGQTTGAAQGVDDMLTQASQSGSPIAQFADQLKKALESGQISPQDAMKAFQQGMQQLGGTAQQSGVQPASGASGSPAASPAAQPDQFQANPAQADPALTGQGHAHGHKAHVAHAKAVDAAADALGMSPSDLRSELKQGKSISDVAQERGVDPNKVNQAVQSSLQQSMPNASADEVQKVAGRIEGAKGGKAGKVHGGGGGGNDKLQQEELQQEQLQQEQLQQQLQQQQQQQQQLLTASDFPQIITG